MLVLARKKGESIMIGDDIEVKIVGVEGDLIRLGITAPKSIKVYRSEVFESIQLENKQALNVSASFMEKIKKNNKNY
ncbi:carbon storage regulator CsrA [Rummeliibacillus pycnus]|uniref:carbon storage regulator CsrA n=1 Tax=Rummeliibacillus pycnus TaxID=101070 RepID=UPI000C9ACCB3|nr:carbon storage regulator CsrA [Rummeliibacillus pycnus]